MHKLQSIVVSRPEKYRLLRSPLILLAHPQGLEFFLQFVVLFRYGCDLLVHDCVVA